jgi:glutamine synthetase type III
VDAGQRGRYQLSPGLAAAVSLEAFRQRISDMLEGIVAADLWPLATYQEMLFIM